MSISLTRYLVEQQRAEGHSPSELRLLLEVVARACKSISQAVNKGALGDVLGTAGSAAAHVALGPPVGAHPVVRRCTSASVFIGDASK